MDDNIFRIVVTVAVALAAVGFLVQAGVMIALYGAVRKMQRKAEPLMERADPVIARVGPAIDNVQALIGRAGTVVDKAGPILDKAAPAVAKAGPLLDKAGLILENTRQIIAESRPRIAEVSTEAVAIARSSRQQVQRVGELLNDAGSRARARLQQIDNSVESTVEYVEQAGDTMKRAVLRPVREASGIAAGVSAAVATLVRGRKYSVDHATQDEEMFI